MPPIKGRQGPHRRRGSQLYGDSAPLLLPLVATVGVNNITATSANLIGSVNDQNLSGTWWFAYGTTPQVSSSTTPQALSASTLPQTLTQTISGLATGATYYFAMVASTAAGTVYGGVQSFVAATQPVSPNASNLPEPTGVPLVSIPHYQFPIKFTAANGVSVVEQDSLEEVFSNVQAIAVCQIGACPELPTFGVPDPTFSQTPINPASLITAIQRQEPRAQETAVSQALGDADSGNWNITLTTQVAGTGQ